MLSPRFREKNDGKLRRESWAVQLAGHGAGRGDWRLSFTNEFGVFTCLQVTRLRCPSSFEWSNDLSRKKSSRRTFYWKLFRGCRFDRAFVVCFDDVFTYKSYSLGAARLWKGRCRLFLDVFGRWSRREILADSKYRYCGLTRTLGAGTEDCWNADEGKGVMGLVLWITKWLDYR